MSRRSNHIFYSPIASSALRGLASISLIMALAGCLAIDGKKKDDSTSTTPSPAPIPPIVNEKCTPGEPFSIGLDGGIDPVKLPPGLVKETKGKRVAGGADFWKFYLKWLKSRKQFTGGNDLQFGLQDPRFKEAQFTQLQVSLEALVFNVDRIRWERLALGVDGFKGTQIDRSAVRVEPIERIYLDNPIHVPANLVLLKGEIEQVLNAQLELINSTDDSSIDIQAKTNQNGISLDWLWELLFGQGGKKNNGNNGKIWVHSYTRVRIVIDLKKFSFGGVTTADDLVRKVASQNRPFGIKIKHVDGWFRLFSGTLQATGVPPAHCPPPPTPGSDTEPPIVRIDSQSVTGLTSNDAQSANFSASEPVSFSCSFDQGEWESCSSSDNNRSGQWSATALADGAHQLSVRAQDASGNTSEVQTIQWTVDTAPPSLSFVSISPSEPVVSTTSLEVAFESDETAQFTCSIDGGEPVACQSPLAFNDVADGSHSIEIVATDLVGLRGTPIVHQWRVQSIPPSVHLSGIFPSRSPTTSSAMTFEFSGDENASTYLCRMDDAEAVSCASPLSFADLIDGSHTFEIRAVDVLGQIGEPAMYSWSIDTLAPEVFMLSVIPAKNPTVEDTIQLSFGASETSTFKCALDDQPSFTCSSPVSLEGLPEGEHHLRILATDTAGNESVVALEYAWVIDRTPPEVQLTGIDPEGSIINSKTLRLNFEANEPATFECRMDDAPFASCSSPFVFSEMTDGSHVVEIRAFDMAGNPSLSVTHAFGVDTTAPSVVISSVSPNASVTNIRSRQYTFTAAETVASFECQIDSAGFAPCASPVSYTNLPEGSHVFRVRAIDAAGNVTNEPSIDSWRIDATAPETTLLAITPSSNPTDSTSIIFEFASNETGTRFECQRDSAPYAPCSSPYTLNNLADGTHTFNVRAIDTAGNVDASPSPYTWQVDTTPLVISALQVSFITASSATVTWTTNKPATSQVQFTNVATGATGLTAINTTLETSHSVVVSGLSRFTLYSVVGLSTSAIGQKSTSGAFSFRTAR